MPMRPTRCAFATMARVRVGRYFGAILRLHRLPRLQQHHAAWQSGKSVSENAGNRVWTGVELLERHTSG